MRKILIITFVILLVTGCKSTQAQVLYCQFYDEDFKVSIEIEYKEKDITQIKQETIEQIVPEISESMRIILNTFSESFVNIEGVDANLDFNTEETEYTYTLMLDFKNLDFDMFEEMISISSYGPELSLISRNLELNNYRDALEKEGFTCK